jgi:hypothetical protein
VFNPGQVTMQRSSVSGAVSARCCYDYTQALKEHDTVAVPKSESRNNRNGPTSNAANTLVWKLFLDGIDTISLIYRSTRDCKDDFENLPVSNLWNPLYNFLL